MQTIYNNVCPLDCFASCRLKTYVENGRIARIKGDLGDEYTKGCLCAKGYALLERVYAPDRITYPMKQRNKGSNSWQRISWEQALTEIAEKLIKIKQDTGNLWPVCFDQYLGTMGVLRQSVEGFFNSIGYITKMTGAPCDPAGSDALTLCYGAIKKPVPEDMLNSQVIIIWGANPAWTASHQMRYVFEAREQGAKIVVIDPIFTATAARSDLYLQVNPGTDGELALGIARVLLDEDLLDQTFLSRYTYDWPRFRSYLESVNLNKTAVLTGIPVKEIRELARIYGKHKPATIWLGLGAQRAIFGGRKFRLINALAAMTGNIGVAGGNVHYLTFEAWAVSGAFTGLQALADSSIGNNIEIPKQHRKIGTGRFAALGDLNPPIEFFWVAGRNPVSQDPDSSRIKQSLRKIKTVVVADLFLTETAKYADYFLPVTTPFESEDVVLSFWHYGAAVNEKAIEAVGESKPDFQIMRELANVLNTIQPGFSTFPVQREASKWLDIEMKELYPLLGIKNYKDLRFHYRRVNLPSVPWENKIFLTPSGKYEFLTDCTESNQVSLVSKPSQEPETSAAYPYRLMTVRNFALLNSQFKNSLRLQSLEKTSIAMIHPDTGHLKNIVSRDKVKVYNQLGEITLEVCLTPSVPLDLVVAYVGSNTGEELNTLVAFAETDLGDTVYGVKGLSFNPNKVDIYKVIRR